MHPLGKKETQTECNGLTANATEKARKKFKDKPDYVMILPWNFREEIIRQQQDFLAGGGRFIVPIPDMEVVPS